MLPPSVFLAPGCSLAGSPTSWVLHPFFSSAVNDISNALDGGADPSVLIGELVKNYGTHIVNSVSYGGSAQLVIQMSVSDQSNLANQGFDIQAQAAGVLYGAELEASGSFASNTTALQNIKSKSATFETLLFPSSVQLAVDASGMVQCDKWSEALKASNTDGTYQPVSPVPWSAPAGAADT